MSQASPAARTRTRAARPEGGPGTPTAAARLADAGLIGAFLALTFLLGAFPLKDFDFWWHLRTGDLIRQTGQVPTVDEFTFGFGGRSWVDLHWGFQVALSWGYAHGGVVMLTLAKCAITTLAVGILISARRPGWPAWVMVTAWLPALLVLGGRMYIRPETISLLYLAIVLAVLFRWERRPWLALLLPAVQLLWVNTQGLFLLGPILIAFALIDAATRRGALEPARRGWWRIVLAASAMACLACLANPYGLKGAIYPLQLLETMRNPIFKNIGELQPVLTLIKGVGLDNLTLRLHLATMALGALSFLIPISWAAWTRLADRPAGSGPGPKAARAKKKPDGIPVDDPTRWRLGPARLLLYLAFSALSWTATRNSHQFAAVVGTVTAWNFGEWAGAIRARRLRRDPAGSPPRAWPRLAAFGAVGLVILAVASGRFYAWSNEGRTIGLGEEPLWFPHEAVKFAGGPGMPDRLLGYHNGHPALYEYYWGPAKKVYTDARLEVMGPEIYARYRALQERIGKNAGGWDEELAEMGRPAILIDNIHAGNADMSATLLNSRRWRCVRFDPIASVFVHESLSDIVRDHGVDFLAIHFRREAEVAPEDPPTLTATVKALRNVATRLRFRPGGGEQGRALILLGLDYARRLRAADPRGLDGRKQAGLLEYLREPLDSEQPIPRFRLPFDPAFDLSPIRATYELARAREVDPDDGMTQWSLARLFLMRGMDEAALPLLGRFAGQPNVNLQQRAEKARAAEEVAEIRARLGPGPSTKWANLSELDRLVSELLAKGRAATAADVIEAAYPPGSRPPEWTDRLAVLRLHLGQPARARAAYAGSSRPARVAATYLVEGDFASARKAYREAIAAGTDPFEAHYGLALLEQDDGHAAGALAEARLADSAAVNDHSRAAARQIIATAGPYVRDEPASLPGRIGP